MKVASSGDVGHVLVVDERVNRIIGDWQYLYIRTPSSTHT